MEKSNLMMIVIIVLLLALLGTVVGVTFYAYNMMRTMETAAERTGTDRTVRSLSPQEISRVLVGERIITNLSTEGGGATGAVASIQVVVGYDNSQGNESAAMAELITNQMLHIRGIALESISSRTYQELSSREGMPALSAEILQRLQDEYNTNMIVDVSFNDWIINR